MAFSYDPNTTPVVIPPPGVIPNFTNPVSRAPITRNVIYAFLPLMVVFMAIRMFSRIIVKHSFGFDDALFLLSGASTTVTCGILLSLLDHPNGRHLWDVPISIITDSYLKINFTFVLVAGLSACLLKISLLALYLRLFNPIKKVTIAIYSCAGIIILFYLATLIAELVIGIPKRGEGWEAAQIKYGPYALNLSVARGVFGFVADFVVLCIPLTQIVPLHLPLRKKVVLLGIFLTGLVACTCSTITCAYRFKSLHDLDYTWSNTLPNTFSIVELTVGLICCAAPTLPPLITYLSKSETVVSLMHYLRSTRNRRNSSEDPAYVPSGSTKQASPNIPRGQLTGLRSFMRRAGLSKHGNTQEKEPSEYHDLESIDTDYHAQLRKEARAQAPNESSL